jgi:rod shape-determining protein MreB
MPTPSRNHLLALDLGSSRVRVATADGQNRAELPALVLVTEPPAQVIAAGNGAATIAAGTLPPGIHALHPVRGGIIAAPDPAVALIRAALQEALGTERGWRSLRGGPRVVFGLPAAATDAEQATTRAVLRAAKVREATVVPAPLAAALGAELPVRGTRPYVICDLGAGRVEIALLRNGQVQQAQHWPLGGEWLDRAIIRAVHRRRGNDITPTMAEQARHQAGEIGLIRTRRGDDPEAAQVARRRMGTGPLMQVVTAGGTFGEVRNKPRTTSHVPEFNSEDVQTGLTEGVRPLLEQLNWFWEDLPQAERDTAGEQGLTLTGGLAQTPGLAEAIARALHVPVQVAPDPAGATLRGLVELAAAAPTDPLPAWPWPPLWNND